MMRGFCFLVALAVSCTRADRLGTFYTLDRVYTLYAAGDDDVSWDEAEFKCPYYDGAHLPIIKDFATDREIAEFVEPWRDWELWIGLLDRYTPGYWFWNDGKKIDDYFINWRSGEPNDKFGEGCGAYAASTSDWNDKDCGTNMGFLCQKNREDDAASYHTEYIIGGKRTDPQYGGTFASANKRCSELGYRLAHIPDGEKAEKLKRTSGWNSTTKYWTDDAQYCVLIGVDVQRTANCESDVQYICEGIQPYNLRLSGTQQDYFETRDMSIECIASGLPVPTVKWYKYNSEVSEDPKERLHQITEQGKSKLVISSAELDDAARYRCEAVNDIKGQEKKARTYIDIDIHPYTVDAALFEESKSRSLSADTRDNTMSKEENFDLDIGEDSCEDFKKFSWMLPTVFGLNVIILLALAVLMCKPSTSPKQDHGQSFANHVVYATRGKTDGQA